MQGIHASSVALKNKEVWSPMNLSSPSQSDWWVSKVQDPLCLPLPIQGGWNCIHVWPHLASFVRAGNENSVCLVNTLRPELSRVPSVSYLTVVLISKRCMCFFAFIPSFRPTDVGFGLEESSFCLSPILPRSALCAAWLMEIFSLNSLNRVRWWPLAWFSPGSLAFSY